MSGAGRELTPVDLDESPFGPVPIAGLPFGKNSEEARAMDRLRANFDAARAKVGPGEYAYTDDSLFGIPPRD